ncbi:O-acyltransferase WSD1-like [Pistacia vera]|uniref:O-acyltransferase WSD1-like n=1 Tax=Pistacia vera TaxID=55513 RepID=UPI001262E2D4|nr:O-acyltransferase WSD1-like [Pistacia vera]
MELREPVSPTGQYLNSSALSLSVYAFLEFEVPIDDLPFMPLIKDVFLSINSRFSSIMIVDKNGEKQWKRVEVEIKDHVNVPIFPSGLSAESYDKHLDDYFAKIVMEELPKSRPLWEIHIIKYPTSSAAGVIIFKLHHALGDGFSLIGALLSCLQRADNPSLPLTLPSVQLTSNRNGDCNHKILRSVPKIFSLVSKTVTDFCWSIFKSTLVEDDQTPLRSGDVGVEFRPIAIAAMTFSLDRIKQIKANNGATINDVAVGIIFLGMRLYMQEMSQDSCKAQTTALVLLNTRVFRSYESVKEMAMPSAKTPWGNRFAFLHVPIPQLTDAISSNPLDFVSKTQQVMNDKKSSLAVFLTGQLLEFLKKFRGPEAAARYIHTTLKNSTVGISNLIGPTEKMVLANHPVKGLYFTVAGAPQSLCITIVSYMGKLRVAVGAEKGFVDAHKLKSCIENAFQMIHTAACGIAPQQARA